MVLYFKRKKKYQNLPLTLIINIENVSNIDKSFCIEKIISLKKESSYNNNICKVFQNQFNKQYSLAYKNNVINFLGNS